MRGIGSIVGLVLAGVLGLPPGIARLEAQDFSDFQRFAFSREHNSPLGVVFRAEITRGFELDYFLAMSILELGVAGQDECVDIRPDLDCVKETPDARRFLSPTEVESVLAVFSTVEVESERDPDCPVILQLIINRFTWDDVTLSDDVCAAPRLDWGGRDAWIVVKLLERLRTGGESDCNGNGVDDLVEIARDRSVDDDNDGVPDECIAGDIDGDGDVDLADYITFQAAFSGPNVPTANPRADLDRDGDTDLSDLMLFLTALSGPQ